MRHHTEEFWAMVADEEISILANLPPGFSMRLSTAKEMTAVDYAVREALWSALPTRLKNSYLSTCRAIQED